jgi:hypothetical protein
MDRQLIIKEFYQQYGYLIEYGLKVNGIAHLIGDYNVISIQTPFIFDRTELPKKFMGVDVRDGTPENEMPNEFQISDNSTEYIWAYQRFEGYVDKHLDLIRKTLGNSSLTRAQMLDAICFGDFESHKKMCTKWEAEGTIPKWVNR